MVSDRPLPSPSSSASSIPTSSTHTNTPHTITDLHLATDPLSPTLLATSFIPSSTPLIDHTNNRNVDHHYLQFTSTPITPSSAARRHRPIEIDPMDTNRRFNYRPTALPMDHHRNVDDDAGGARWLSEDEGGDTVRKTNRSGSFGTGTGGGRGGGGSGTRRRGGSNVTGSSSRRPAPGQDQIDVGPPSASGLGLGFGPTEGGEDANRLERDAWGVSQSAVSRMNNAGGHSGHTTGSAAQSPRSGLEEAKAHWKSIGSSSRNRLRRAVSNELVGSPPSTSNDTMGSSSSTMQNHPDSREVPGVISGHPIAPTSGMPMPELKNLAPPPKPSIGGISTYQASSSTSTSSSTQSPNEDTSTGHREQTRQPVQALKLNEALPLSRQSSDANAALALSTLAMGDIPDFATGRGGDGIGGSGLPVNSRMTATESVEESLRIKDEEKQKRKQTVAKLSQILKWSVSVLDQSGHGLSVLILYVCVGQPLLSSRFEIAGTSS
jgi:hypothetical protein